MSLKSQVSVSNTDTIQPELYTRTKSLIRQQSVAGCALGRVYVQMSYDRTRSDLIMMIDKRLFKHFKKNKNKNNLK
jgi:hypothetical protein